MWLGESLKTCWIKHINNAVKRNPTPKSSLPGKSARFFWTLCSLLFDTVALAVLNQGMCQHLAAGKHLQFLPFLNHCLIHSVMTQNQAASFSYPFILLLEHQVKVGWKSFDGCWRGLRVGQGFPAHLRTMAAPTAGDLCSPKWEIHWVKVPPGSGNPIDFSFLETSHKMLHYRRVTC